MKKLLTVKMQIEEQQLYTMLMGPERASEITLVSAERLRDLAEAGFAPAVWVDGRGPFFKRQELIKWVKANLVRLQDEKPLHLSLRPIITQSADPSEVPKALSQFAHELKNFGYGAVSSAVYFLIRGDEVVYVGQSRNLGARIGQHSGDKEFDRVYFIPVPPDSLSQIESALIRSLRPRFNGTCQTDANDHDRMTLARHFRIESKETANVST